jgi:hypothetical protein
MVNVKDLTDKFREAVRSAALKNNYDEVLTSLDSVVSPQNPILFHFLHVGKVVILHQSVVSYYVSKAWLCMQAKMAKVSGSLILHSTPPHTTFTLTAIEILGNIRAMHSFVMKHGKDYLNKNRSTEQDRDKIENEVGLFVKACRERIEVLKNSIGIEEKQAHGASWLAALGRGSQNTDCIAHQHGVVCS